MELYSLNDIFIEAKKDTYAITLDGIGYESRMVFGVKIVRDKESNNIEIINTLIGGDYYRTLEEEDHKVFRQKGWRYGVYVLSLSNYRTKLDLIESRIHKEMNGRASAKQIGLLKLQRERVMGRYSEINYKLNKLNQINYGYSQKNTNT
tara:strand:- start:749 stop:1195 length:447 start_codon:yes stop_codon:yes gene_type:complete